MSLSSPGRAQRPQSSNGNAGPPPAPQPLAMLAALQKAMPDFQAETAFNARLHTSLAAAEPVWRALQAEGIVSVYQRFEWAACIVRHLVKANVGQLAIVEVTDASTGQAVLLLPMVLRLQSRLKVLEWLNFGVCDYCGPVMAKMPDMSSAEAERAWAAAKSVMPAADLIRITGIPARIFGQANPLALLARTRPGEMEASGLALNGDPDTIVQRLCKPSFASDMQKKRNKLSQLPNFSFWQASTEAEISEIFDVLVAQRLKRFQEMGRFDILNDSAYVDFYRAAALDGLNGGPARLFALQAGGEVLATTLVVVHNGAFHGLLLTMGEAKWKAFSPGLLMITEVMKWSRQQGMDYFDLTVGSLPYKEGLGAQKHILFEYCEALSLRGWLLLQVQAVTASARTRIRHNPQVYEKARKLAQWGRKLFARLRPNAA